MRSVLVLVLVTGSLLGGSTVGSAQGAAGSPSPAPSVAPAPSGAPASSGAPPIASPIPSPTPAVAVPIPDIPFEPGTDEAPGGLAWERVDLPMVVATNRLEGLMRWAGGFAMLELRPGGPHGAAVVATWTSPDGRAWARRRLPEPIRPAWSTSLHALGDGLALTTIVTRPSITFGTKRISVLLSDDGRRWRPGAAIDLRVPAGYPDGWVLDFPAIVAAGDRLIAISRLGPNRCCGSAPSATRWASIAGRVAKIGRAHV